jgi:NAD(P)-dependent dehydrogenase (short-subunit alcohol dehydrogenase family)
MESNEVEAAETAFHPHGMRFVGRVAVVTGAASGIGKATAVRLAAEGAAVVCVDVAEEGTTATAHEILAAGGQARAVTADIANEDAVSELFRLIENEYGRLDVVCNVAGILRFASLEETTPELWNQVITTNLTGTFLMCKAAIEPLLATGGNIVNLTSTAAMAGHPWCVAYSASKGGILALTQTIAVEFGRRGVRCNAIAPGSIETPIQAAFRFPDGADKSLLNRIMPLDRMRSPDHVAALIAFVASDEGAHCNGSILRVDSGTLS